MKLDGRVEPPDSLQRLAPHGEVAAVEDDTHPQHVLHEHLGAWAKRQIVGTQQRFPPPVPVVEPVIPRESEERQAPRETLQDALEPENRRTAVGVQVDEQVSTRFPPPALTRFDETFRGLIDHTHSWYAASDVAGAIGAGVVDYENLIGEARLRQKRMEAGRHERFLVVGADDDSDCQSRAGYLQDVTPL